MPNNREPIQIREILELVQNRPVVPFLGAGISVASGFPSIRQVNHYLAKVDFAIQNEVFRHRYASLGQKPGSYRLHPCQFLRDFGWPELGRLDADLWQWLKDSTNLKQLADDCHSINPNHEEPIQDLLAYDLCDINGKSRVPLRDFLTAIVQHHLRNDLGRLESGADDAALRQWKRWKQWKKGKIPVNSKSFELAEEPELLIGNWESLLDHLTEGSFELVDQLFTQLEKGRTTSPSHKYLAFLSRMLDLPLVLTTNFDRFIEQAFFAEGIDFRAFDVHKDAELPAAEIIRRQLSIIKLHGSSYGLRLGERLKYPFDANSKQQILEIMPRNALMFVMGFSGYERRMLQLLRTVAEQNCGGVVKIIWFTLRELEGWPKSLLEEFPKSINQCIITDAGAFLKELTFGLSKCYPPTKTTYAAFNDISAPILSRKRNTGVSQHEVSVTPSLTSKERQKKLKRDLRLLKNPVHVFYPKDLQNALEADSSISSTEAASLAAAAFVKSLPSSQFRPIWISLETHHTVSGIISEFFERVRQFDPYCPLPPLNLSIDGHLSSSTGTIDQHDKIIARFLDVFQSGRYVLILDLLDCFGRPQTVWNAPVFCTSAYERFS